MATPSILKNCKFYLDKYDLSGFSNSLLLEQEYDEVDCTAFGDTARNGIPGLVRVSFDHQGHFAADATAADGSDDAMAAKIATANVPMMVCPTTGAAGALAYFVPQMAAKYSWGGSVGDINAFTVTGAGTGCKIIRGYMMATGSKTTTGDGTAYELGDVGATQHLYAQLHVFSVSGTDPTLDVIVTSDDAEGFADPTTRITFTQATAATAQWATPIAGEITDDWWRVTYTIGGTETPTFNFAVAIGIA
jgi:hypothetical protein